MSTWMKDQHSSSPLAFGHPASSTPRTTSPSHVSAPCTPSTASSSSSSPRTPSPPINSPYTHTPQHSLDVQLTKSFDNLTITVTPPPTSLSLSHNAHHNRNYKNLHLAQPLTRTPTRLQTRVQSRALSQTHTTTFSHTRGIFDSSPNTYPSLHIYPYSHPDNEDDIDGAEPYIFYSSSNRTAEPRRATASIGEFPTPRTSIAASSSPSRTLTFTGAKPSPGGTSLNTRQIGEH